jgi:tRNA(Arg) A34 adenosine deaminase TadA
VALRLAWEAFRVGTTPVGAVVVGELGEVIAAGRGRRLDRDPAPPGQLAGVHVAHAEINALAQLAASRVWRDAFLLTTLEPCLMCRGAARQATVWGFAYAGRDPYAGTAGLEIDSAQTRHHRPVIQGPLTDRRGRLAELLHVAWVMDVSTAQVQVAMANGLPEVVAAFEVNREKLRAAAEADDYEAALALVR